MKTLEFKLYPTWELEDQIKEIRGTRLMQLISYVAQTPV